MTQILELTQRNNGENKAVERIFAYFIESKPASNLTLSGSGSLSAKLCVSCEYFSAHSFICIFAFAH